MRSRASGGSETSHRVTSGSPGKGCYVGRHVQAARGQRARNGQAHYQNVVPVTPARRKPKCARYSLLRLSLTPKMIAHTRKFLYEVAGRVGRGREWNTISVLRRSSPYAGVGVSIRPGAHLDEARRITLDRRRAAAAPSRLAETTVGICGNSRPTSKLPPMETAPAAGQPSLCFARRKQPQRRQRGGPVSIRRRQKR